MQVTLQRGSLDVFAACALLAACAPLDVPAPEPIAVPHIAVEIPGALRLVIVRDTPTEVGWEVRCAGTFDDAPEINVLVTDVELGLAEGRGGGGPSCTTGPDTSIISGTFVKGAGQHPASGIGRGPRGPTTRPGELWSIQLQAGPDGAIGIRGRTYVQGADARLHATGP